MTSVSHEEYNRIMAAITITYHSQPNGGGHFVVVDDEDPVERVYFRRELRHLLIDGTFASWTPEIADEVLWDLALYEETGVPWVELVSNY